MTKQSKMTFDLGGLEDLAKEAKNYVARVGVLGDNARNDSEVGNAEIGVIHEFGSESNNIPPRSFLRMPMEEKRDDIMRALSSGAAKEAIEKKDWRKLLKQVGVAGEIAVQQAFASGGFGQWPINAKSTVRSKGSSAPLIDTSQLRRSITSDVVRRGEIDTS